MVLPKKTNKNAGVYGPGGVNDVLLCLKSVLCPFCGGYRLGILLPIRLLTG